MCKVKARSKLESSFHSLDSRVSKPACKKIKLAQNAIIYLTKVLHEYEGILKKDQVKVRPQKVTKNKSHKHAL